MCIYKRISLCFLFQFHRDGQNQLKDIKFDFNPAQGVVCVYVHARVCV